MLFNHLCSALHCEFTFLYRNIQFLSQHLIPLRLRYFKQSLRMHVNFKILKPLKQALHRLQYLPYSYHVTQCSEHYKEMENSMYVFNLVDTIKYGTCNVSNTLAHYPQEGRK